MPRVKPYEAQVGIYTYGEKGKAASVPNAQYVINVAGLRDPSSNRGYRQKYKDGRPGEIQDYVKEDPRVEAIVHQIKMLAHIGLRSDAQDGKFLSFALRDHHGVWIAPAIGEIVTDALDREGYAVALFHFELSKETNP